MTDTTTTTQVALVALSQWIDAHNAHRPDEVNLWSRVVKASEEAAEAQAALRLYLGENPRKGTGPIEDIIDELLDTAVAALGAVEHLRGHDGHALQLLDMKIIRVAIRAGVA